MWAFGTVTRACVTKVKNKLVLFTKFVKEHKVALSKFIGMKECQICFDHLAYLFFIVVYAKPLLYFLLKFSYC